jgi:hypothetical protein
VYVLSFLAWLLFWVSAPWKMIHYSGVAEELVAFLLDRGTEFGSGGC